MHGCTASSVPESARTVLARAGHQPFSRRNYLAHSLEGGIYVGGVAFLAVETVLPAMMYELGAPQALIGVMPVLMMLGFSLPSLFTAHLFEHRPQMKPFLLVSGVFQRLPYLAGFLLLFFAAESHPVATMIGVALVPFVSGLLGGVGAPAWMELTSKLLPPRRRSSALALRMAIGALLGVAAGAVIELVLAAQPGPRGYAWLHLCTFGCLVGSYLVFSLQRELDDPRRAAAGRRSLAGNLATIPSLLRAAPHLRRFLIAIFCALAIWAVVPFLVLYVQQRLGVAPEFVGRLVSAQMVGALIGNACAAWLGDRRGGRAVLTTALLVHLVVFASAGFAGSELAFLLVFAGWGFGFGLHQVGGFALAMDVMPIDRRPTGMALLAATNAVGLVVMSVLGGQIQQWWPGEGVALWPAVGLVSGFLVVALAALRGLDPGGTAIGAPAAR